MSSRFVAGTSVEEVLTAAAAVNGHGMATTLDSLGENVHSPEEAQRAADVYHRLLDAIKQRQAEQKAGQQQADFFFEQRVHALAFFKSSCQLRRSDADP